MKSVRLPVVTFSIAVAIATILLGCGHIAPETAEQRAADAPSLQKDQRQRIDELTQALLALDSGVSEKEARGVAQSAVTHAAILGRRYRIVRPPQLHNLLVKFGWKKRGLCYHWAEDLLKHLEELNLRHLQLQRVVAHRGSDLREHHSVLVISREKSYQEGIVLDGWRGSGDLFWAPAGEDRYPWVPLDGEKRSETGAEAH
jgi:hypothetical protein